MERTEPSFIPEWLKGTAGGGVGLSTHNNTDEGGFPKTKVTQQLLAVGNNLESPRKSVSTSKSFSSTSRRNHNSGSLDRQSSDRDHFGLVRSKSGLHRNLSNRNHSKLNLEQNGYNSWIDGDEADKDFYSRKKEWLSGMVPDGRDKDKEFGDTAMRQMYSAAMTGKFDAGAKLKRSQSMGLSASGKVTEVVTTLPSANGNLAMNAQKTAFEHNFPTLGIDDKQSSPRSSIGSASMSSPRPTIANSHFMWQGNVRSDLSRASSPGLTAGFTNSISISAGSDSWSSALADVPTSNGNTVAANATAVASFSQTSASLAGPVTSATPLNMAEALTQNPPRVRTPPQSSLETQRLEEFALRQSRQLIPMTPSLPKTMSLVDKTKSKSMRAADGPTLKLQSSSSQKLVTQSKLDSPKPSQSKLLVLKSVKDGVSSPSTSKSDGSAIPQVAIQGNVGSTAVSSATITPGQRKQIHDRRGSIAADGSRTKDSVLPVEDKRIALNAQNRSDFFNTLRRKAAGNGTNASVSSSSTCEAKTDSLIPSEAALVTEGGHVDTSSEAKENGVCEGLHFSQPLYKAQSNGDAAISSGNGSTNDSFVKNLSVAESKENRHSPSPGDLEAEEAAFMRSLGWEENEEGSELTEEEINSFYQSLQTREKKMLQKSKGNLSFSAEHVVGSVGSMSSGLSSSDSETEEASSLVLRRAVSNSTKEMTLH